MSKININEIRERLNGGEDLWDELVEALDAEIYRLKGTMEDYDDASISPSSLVSSTKAEVWAKIQRKAGTCLYMSLKQIREAIEEVE